MNERCRGVILAIVLAAVVPVSSQAQPQADPQGKEVPPAGANGELERDLALPDSLDNSNEPEDRLVILPEIKRDGREFHIGFWDTDMFDVRERFDELLDEHPAVTLLDGDREWLTATIDAPDPEALVPELWAQAQELAGS